MSANSPPKSPPRNQPEIPGYFRKDRVGRDAFLSQLGHFGEDLRSLFSRLCDMWEPDLPYSKFFAKAGHEYLKADSVLQTLMGHLERGNCGLIANIVRGGELERDRIILTDRDALRFWYWYVENLWQRARISDREDFPAVKNLKKKPGFPSKLLHPIALAELSGNFIQTHSDEVILYVLPDLEGQSLVVTPASLSYLIEVSRLKIRAHLSDSPVLPVLARLQGTVVSSLRKDLQHSDNSFWNKLAGTILSNREDLLAKHSNLAVDIFISAKVLQSYTRNELDDAEQRREENAEKRATIKAILKHLVSKDSLLMSSEEFDSQFEPYSHNWPDLKELFFEHYLRPRSSVGLPAVVTVGSDYVYRDYIFPLFKSWHAQAEVELREYYLNLAEKILRSGNRDKFTAFTGITAFRDDVQEKLTAEFEILSELLSMPRIVSEGIIHYASKVLKITDMERVKSMLSRYFEGASLRFRPPDVLFHLIPGELLSEAFRRLNWFRRLVLKLFGRYDSYAQSFERSPGGEYQRTVSQGIPAGERRTTRAGRTSGKRLYESQPKKIKKQQPRGYSAKQQEEAWEEFKSAYHKKRGD